MKLFIKNIIALILGVLCGMIINMGLIIIGGKIMPFPENFIPMNAMDWNLKYFIFPFLAHSIGTLSGSFVASKLSKKYHVIIPLIVGIYFLSGGIYMAIILPAPIWFICLDLIACYIPMALLGWSLTKNKHS